MSDLNRLEKRREELHQKIYSAAFASYLRTGRVPQRVHVLLEATRSLETMVKYSTSQPRAPAGSPDGGQWVDGGGGDTENTTNKKRMNVDRAIQHLNSNAKRTSTGRCAAYVRRAIQAGGVDLKAPYPASAKEYGAYLGPYTFMAVTPRPVPSFKPEKGDIVVIQPYSQSHPHGHIAMYNGDRWVSDFFQNAYSIWPGAGYEKYKPLYEIYRQ